MFASILPGIRELRVPLAAGLLWSGLIWVWLARTDLETLFASPFVSSVTQLVAAIGQPALLAILTFFSYVLGVLLSFLPRLLARVIRSVPRVRERALRRLAPGFRVLGITSRIELHRLAAAALDTARSRGATIDQVLAVLPGEPTLERSARTPTSESSQARLSRERRRWASRREDLTTAVTDALRDDMSLVAVRLHATNADLFGDYDRARSEAEFRFAIALPIAALAASWGLLSGSPSWLVVGSVAGVTLFMLLVVMASQKLGEAQATLVQLLAINVVDSPTLENIRVLSRETPRARTTPSDQKAGEI
jgi:hypothetical protein